ncbi:MAG TPA: hypothetical protein VEB42_13515 [Chitinophagaceae bacterium]|nr:hypothetical protein [Chitinophagaceae bacterium]
MKWLLIICMFFLMSAETNCGNKKKTAELPENCFKGKLEVKANCMNYTVSIVSGNMDTSRYVASWTDEHSGKSYKNVFALGSRCNFPATINEGDEFYFVIDSSTVQDCAVCMMYYPVPSKQLNIRVIQDPCTNNSSN